MAGDGGAAPEGVAELRDCLFRLKTECEIEGLHTRAGFDAWVAWANELLAALDAPVSRPGRLASEDARAEATRLPKQPSQGFGHQSRSQSVPFAFAPEGKSDAGAQTGAVGNTDAARRAADAGVGVAHLAGIAIAAACSRDRCTDLERELAAAEARAEAAERRLGGGAVGVVDALRADLANAAGGMAEHICEGCGAALMVDEDAATTTDVVGCWPYVTGEDKHGQCWRYRTAAGMDRAWPACPLAAQLGGSARGRGATIRKSRTVGDADPTTPSDGGEHVD